MIFACGKKHSSKTILLFLNKVEFYEACGNAALRYDPAEAMDSPATTLDDDRNIPVYFFG